MGTRIGRALVAGAVMWTGLTACSAALQTPGPSPAGPAVSSGLRGRSRPPGPPLAIVWEHRDDSDRLERLDPETLETRRRMDLGLQAARVYSLSPDRTLLMMSTMKGHIRIVDLRRLEGVVRFPLNLNPVMDLAWPADDVAVATVAGERGTKLVRFDPATGDVLGTDTLAEIAFAFEHAGDGLVFLARDPDTGKEPGGTTIGTFDTRGNLSTRRIEEIHSGYYLPDGEDLYARLIPGLAVSPSGATVVGVDGTIASVDLTDLSVQIEGGESFFDGLAAWFGPPAHAKTLGGTALEAEWISPDALLVTGYRISITRTSETSTLEHPEAAGAVVLDPSDWSRHVVDPDATLAYPAGELLLTARDFVPGDEQGDGFGVRAYDSAGNLRWHALGSKFVHVGGIYGDKAIVRYGWGRALISTIDLDTGRVLRTRRLSATFPPARSPL